ncbi:MAG: ABC transporter substrate-binding protein [Rhodospirillales bacterium]|nr:ABC transporter substrate-binding protein [Rhodospirillales bacterium]
MERTISLGRRGMLAGGLALPLLASRRARAAGKPLKIGVLCDMSGIYADDTGPGLVAGVKVAVDQAGGVAGDRPIELVYADDQNKPDVGTAIAGRWIAEQNVSAIVCASASSITLAVSDMVSERNKVLLVAGSLSADLTGKRCHPSTFQFGLDTYAGPASVIGPSIKAGADSWFIINVDYAFGQSLRDEGARLIAANGGKLLGTTSFPLGTADFASQILQAKTSGAKAIALACGGTDWSNLVKQLHEFGIAQGGQNLVTLTGGINEIQAVGAQYCLGMMLSTPFYWDLDDGSRAFSAKFRPYHNGRFPNWQQSDGYSGALHYIKAVAAAGTDDGAKVAETMRAMPVNDLLIKDATIRADGQVMRPTYLMKVKPETAPERADIFAYVSTLSAEQSWRPAAESACPALRKS